jgi:FtsP/CotA-like multicopper oxidase with cupredoxin domain
MTRLTRVILLFFFFISFTSSAQYNPLWIPDTLTGPTFNLTVRDTFRQFMAGQQTITAAVNGDWWGPTLIWNKWDTIQLNVINELTDSTTMHWHGIHLPAQMDGGPHQPVPPNTTWSPSFTVLNNAATYWYHPHLHMMVEEQVNMGIGGMIIIRDSTESLLNIPRTYGVDDIPLVLTDRRFDASNQIVMSHFGDTMVVNGTLNPEYTVPAQVIRMRLVNSAPERFYRFGFSNNATFRVIATDGGLLNAPVSQTRFTLAPGERVEILVNFSGLNGSSVDLVAYNNTLPGDVAGSSTGTGTFANALGGRQFNILHLNIGPQTANPVTTFPVTLANYTFPSAASATNTRHITMSDGGANCPASFTGCGWLDSTFFNMNVINQTIVLNTMEIWEIQNVSAFAHPFHMHNVQFYILDRNGIAAPTYERGWKDVMQVRTNTTARFITRFTDYADSTKPYMYHCHNLFHEDGGMMGQFVVIDTMRAPIAGIVASDTVICIGDCISFNVAPTTNVDQFVWDFDGGSPSSANTQTVNVCYSQAGSYDVSLAETNQIGSDIITAQNLITVLPLPSVAVTADDSVCLNSGAVQLVGSPAGGSYSGQHVTGSAFNPSVAGSYNIIYNYTDGNGCSNSDTTSVVVSPLPVVQVSFADSVCVNAGPIALNGNPAGGNFSGTGVSGNTFDPAASGAGIFTITYSYTDINGCNNEDSATITAVDTTVVNILTSGAFCENDGLISLSAQPSGGFFSGTGVSGQTLDPLISGTGNHPVTYIYTDANGCTSADIEPLTINIAPNVSLDGTDTLCITDAPLVLNENPQGGIFSGAINTSVFDPSLFSSGIYTVYYTYTNGFGCDATDSLDISVFDIPAILFSIADSVCENDGMIPLNATPAGGIFSGTGVSGNSFSTITGGTGSFYIYYSYTASSGCQANDSTLITVSANPSATINGPSQLCIDAGATTLTGNPSGGIFSGAGISGSDFNPSIAGIGSHDILYIYTSPEGCSDTALLNITVTGLPTVDLQGPASACVNSAPVSFNPAPTGGIFNGPGIINDEFNPSVTGAGTFTVAYIYTDQFGCSNSDTIEITVYDSPAVTLSVPDTVCNGTDNIPLSGSPPGGSYNGTGVTDSTFNSTISGAGSFLITYNYIDSNLCSGLSQATVVVVDTPSISITAPDTLCTLDGPSVLMATPAGGMFTGPGVTGNMFNPFASGTGTFLISYIYSGPGNCSDTGNVFITVENCIGITENKNDFVHVYPNPVDDELYVVMKQHVQSISLFNEIGQQLITLNPKEDFVIIPTANISSGLLNLRILKDGMYYYYKIIKK